MTHIYILILILVIILYLSFSDIQQNRMEHMADTATPTSALPISNEAIQNVSSIYNTKDMKVTNMISTNAESTTAKIGNLTVTGTSDLKGDLTITGQTKILGSISGKDGGGINIKTQYGSLAIGPVYGPYCHMITDRDVFYFNKPLVIDGNQIQTYNNGNLRLPNPLQEQVIIVYPGAWSSASFVEAVRANNYFNKSMPDGTMLKFLFLTTISGRTNAWYGHGIKIGSQFLLYGLGNPQHTDIQNADKDWRAPVI